MIFNIGQSSSVRNYNEYIEHWKNAMEEAYSIANRRSFSVGERNKSRYDLKAKSIGLRPNDRVQMSQKQLAHFWFPSPIYENGPLL